VQSTPAIQSLPTVRIETLYYFLTLGNVHPQWRSGKRRHAFEPLRPPTGPKSEDPPQLTEPSPKTLPG